MRREVRALLHILVGAAVLHLSLFSDLYLRYVRAALRPYLIASGVLLVATGLIGAVAAARELLRPDRHGDTDDGHDHGHGAPRTAWLLLLPVLAIYLLQPQALGAFTAQHSDTTAVRPAAAARFAPLPTTDPIALRIADFDSRALWDKSGSLKGHRIRLTGFATPGPGDGTWDLARLTISCCAADASGSKVVIYDADAPPKGTWVEVTGEWRPDDSQDGTVPALNAILVRRIPEPADPYE